MEFLSEEYFTALAARLSAAPLDEEADRVAIGQLVTDAPGGDVAWTVHLGGGEPARLERDSLAGADVTLVEDYATARALAGGEGVADALRAGKIKVRGDANTLVAHYARLAALVAVAP